jgi:hypothetical protein
MARMRLPSVDLSFRRPFAGTAVAMVVAVPLAVALGAAPAQAKPSQPVGDSLAFTAASKASLKDEDCRGRSRLILQPPKTTSLGAGATMKVWDDKTKKKVLKKQLRKAHKKYKKRPKVRAKVKQKLRIKAAKHLRIVAVTVPKGSSFQGHALARYSVTGVGRTSSHALSLPNATVVTNGSVFSIGGKGAPYGPQVVEGATRKLSRSFEGAMVTFASGTSTFARLAVKGKVEIGELDYQVAGINQGSVYTESVSIYTPDWGGASRKLGVVELVVDQVTGTVREVRSGDARGQAVPAGTFIVTASGPAGNELALVPVGTQVVRGDYLVARSVNAPYTDYDTVTDPVRSAIGFSSRLIKQGAIAAGQCTSRNELRRPRTVYGLNAAGDLIVMTISGRYGRGASLVGGASVRQASRYLKALGAVEAINLDGGGSTTMFVRRGAALVRYDRGVGVGSQRSVGNAYGFAVGSPMPVPTPTPTPTPTSTPTATPTATDPPTP